jgi:DNA-binding GntR family transcriptional regulator
MPQRGQLTEGAYQTVMQRLRNGDYATGQRISVEDLVIELGASRQPVMDALKRLSTEGFLDIIPQVGVQVIVPERNDFVDFFRLLAAIEGLCAELAAERADAAGVQRLAEISAEFGILVNRDNGDSGDKLAYRAVNYAFHLQVRKLAQSAVLAAYADGLWARSDFYLSTIIGRELFADRHGGSHEEHEVISRAIAANDPATARQAMEQHILAFVEVFLASEQAAAEANSSAPPLQPPSR